MLGKTSQYGRNIMPQAKEEMPQATTNSASGKVRVASSNFLLIPQAKTVATIEPYGTTVECGTLGE